MAARKSEVTSGQLRIVGGDKVVADFRDADAAKLFGTLKPGSEFVKSGHSRKKNVVGPRFEIVEMTTDGAGLHVVFRLVKDDSPIERLLAELLDQFNALDYSDLVLDDPQRVAKRMASLLPVASPADRAVGPFYTTSALVTWLGITRQAINARVKDRTLLGLPTADGPLAYPTWQFTDGGATISHLSDTLKALATGTDDRWTWAAWLAALPKKRFDGGPAWKWLATGRDPDVVIRAARHDAAVWAH